MATRVEIKQRHEKLRQKILEVARNEFLTLSQLAQKVGIPKNTMRAKYLYPMVADGLLEKRAPKRTSSQAYKAKKSVR